MKFFQQKSIFKANMENSAGRSESLWTSNAPAIPAIPRFENQQKADLTIIGGGYTGLSCAYYAKKMRPDWNIVVLESNRLGSGASSRNSGVVYPAYRGHGNTPMAARGFDRLVRFMDDERIECDFKNISVLEFYLSRQKAEKEGAFEHSGAEWVSSGDLENMLNTSFYPHAVEQQHYYFLDPAKLVSGHVKAVQRMGVELYEFSPVIAVKAGKPATLMTPKGSLQTDHVFIATNGYTPRLGFLRRFMVPVHQYTMATRRLTVEEIRQFELDRWPIRFEMRMLPVTCGLMQNSRFFVRAVLGYASFNSCNWRDVDGARKKVTKIIQKRYPWLADIGLTDGWHGLTGHTLNKHEIASLIHQDNIHASVAYNGLGIMPGHNNGYLSACRITGRTEEDLEYLTKPARHYPIPGELLRSMIFKPVMRIMTP